MFGVKQGQLNGTEHNKHQGGTKLQEEETENQGDLLRQQAIHSGKGWLGDKKRVEFAGLLGVGLAGGDTIFREEPAPAATTLMAGPEGAVTLSLTHLHWRLAHSLETISLIRKLPTFRRVATHRLERLACAMEKHKLRFREVLPPYPIPLLTT